MTVEKKKSKREKLFNPISDGNLAVVQEARQLCNSRISLVLRTLSDVPNIEIPDEVGPMML